MIEYDNMLNPIRIQFANGNVTKYVYSPEGEKVQTIHYTAIPNISLPDLCVHELTEDEILAADTVDYLLDGKLIMKNGRIDKYLFDGGYFKAYTQQLCIMPLPTPSWMHDGTEPTPEQVEEYEKKIEEVRKVIKENQVSDSFNILYYNKDHLGNVREVIDDRGKVCQTNNYYPYGTPFCDGPCNGRCRAAVQIQRKGAGPHARTGHIPLRCKAVLSRSAHLGQAGPAVRQLHIHVAVQLLSG